MQLPAGVREVQALPQHRFFEQGLAKMRQPPAFRGLFFQPVAHGAQGFIGVLARFLYFLCILRAQRLQQAVAPVVAAGQKHHAMGIGGQHNIGRELPFALQLLQRNLDGDQPQRPPLVIMNGARQKVAGQARRHANAVKTPAALRQRLLHIRAKAVILAHIAV